MRPVVLAGILATALACAGADPTIRARRAERDQLRREVVGYRDLEPLARTGLLTTDDEVIVTVSDTLIRSLLEAAFPVSVRIPGGVMVTLTGATVAFRANVARVDVVGELRRDAFPSVAASVALRGALDAFVVDTARVLRARLTIDDALVTAPNGVPRALDAVAVALLQRLVERNLFDVASTLPSVAIPVRFDRSIILPGFNPKGALTVRPASAPLSVTATRLIAFQDRLWIILRVTRGAFVVAAGAP